MRRKRAQTRTWLFTRAGRRGGPLWQTSHLRVSNCGEPDPSATLNVFTPVCFVLAAVSRASRSFFR
eukprot:3186923-Prymnesium_polylepis.1